MISDGFAVVFLTRISTITPIACTTKTETYHHRYTQTRIYAHLCASKREKSYLVSHYIIDAIPTLGHYSHLVSHYTGHTCLLVEKTKKSPLSALSENLKNAKPTAEKFQPKFSTNF